MDIRVFIIEDENDKLKNLKCTINELKKEYNEASEVELKTLMRTGRRHYAAMRNMSIREIKHEYVEKNSYQFDGEVHKKNVDVLIDEMKQCGEQRIVLLLDLVISKKDREVMRSMAVNNQASNFEPRNAVYIAKSVLENIESSIVIVQSVWGHELNQYVRDELGHYGDRFKYIHRQLFDVLRRSEGISTLASMISEIKGV